MKTDKALLEEALDLLDATAASLENVLLQFGPAMSHSDAVTRGRVCDTAQAFVLAQRPLPEDAPLRVFTIELTKQIVVHVEAADGQQARELAQGHDDDCLNDEAWTKAHPDLAVLGLSTPV